MVEKAARVAAEVARPDKRNVTRLYSEKFNFFKRRTQGVWR